MFCQTFFLCTFSDADAMNCFPFSISPLAFYHLYQDKCNCSNYSTVKVITLDFKIHFKNACFLIKVIPLRKQR